MRARWLAVAAIVAGVPGASLVSVASAVPAPSSSITSATTALTSTTTFTSGTAAAACPAGSTLVGGGQELTTSGAPSPNNGSVILGGVPSGATTDPTTWTATGGYSGQAPGTSVLTSMAVCATGITSATEAVTATTASQSLGPITATCPAGTSLVGGGGGYTGFQPGTNTKLYDSYPSDSTGTAAADGGTDPTSWTVQGNSNSASGNTTSATALCATDVTVPTVVATGANSAAPVAGGALVTATASCPAGASLLDGGSDLTANPSGPGTGGQGVHLVGDMPSDASGNPVTTGAAPAWTVDAQDGGQSLTSLAATSYALCAAAAVTMTPQAITFPAPSPATVGQTATLSATGGASGNPVTFTVDPTTPAGVCSVSGTDGATVSYTGVGTCTIDANQTGNGTYSAAPQVTQAVTVSAAAPPPATQNGYAMVGAGATVYPFGAGCNGTTVGASQLAAPIVGIAETPDGGGCYLVGADGGVFALGDARYQGSEGGQKLAKPIVGLAVDPVTGGYWLVASDGGIFSFNAPFHGSEGATPLRKPVVGMAATADGGGYDLVASDGGVFSLGDATFHGSTGAITLVKPVVGIALDAATGGYWLAASDGGVFAFAAPFHGSAGGLALAAPVVGITPSADAGGYYLAGADGGVFTYGDASFAGAASVRAPTPPVVGISVVPVARPA